MSKATGRLTNREDLFIGSARPAANEKKEEFKSESIDEDRKDNDDENPIQLEHMLGFGASYSQSVIMIPTSDELVVKRFLKS